MRQADAVGWTIKHEFYSAPSQTSAASEFLNHLLVFFLFNRLRALHKSQCLLKKHTIKKLFDTVNRESDNFMQITDLPIIGDFIVFGDERVWESARHGSGDIQICFAC